MKNKIVFAVLALFASTAFAAQPQQSSHYSSYSSAMPKGQIIGYLVDEHEHGCCGSSNSDLGLGARGWWGIPNSPFFLHGEFQTVGDVDQLRLGGGAVGPIQSNLMWIGKIEYIDFMLNGPSDETGFGLHGGLLFTATPQLDLFGTLGYLDTDHTDGLELDAGGQFHLSRELSLVGDLRLYRGSVSPGDFHLDDLRFGVSYLFW